MNLKENIFIANTSEEIAEKLKVIFKDVNYKGFDFQTFEMIKQTAYYGIHKGVLRCIGDMDKEFTKIVKLTTTNPEDLIEKEVTDKPAMRQFSTGATRNVDENKLDFEGFLSPLALEEFAIYMHKNRKQADGQLRDSDNWMKGIPVDAYMKSMWRHFFDVWKNHRGLLTPEDQITNLCGLMFNVQGMLHELLKTQGKNE